MAIYSLNHRPIGKTTQSRPYTASSHVGYITRRGAKPQVAAARMPDKAADAQAFFRKIENTSRANARVGDKLMLALPRELSPEQRVALVRGYAEQITQGRAPWFAAFHDNGTDSHNPHCHLIFHDRDQDTGRRVFGTTEAGSTERLRRLWQRHANEALAGAERPERIDHRSLEAQGIKRPAPIHEGPKSQAARRRGVRPRSRSVNARNGRGARSRYRQVDYPRIDQGRTRAEFNRAMAVGAESEQDYWQAIDADRQASELDALRAIHRPPESVEVFRVDDLGRQHPLQDWVGGVNAFTGWGGGRLFDWAPQGGRKRPLEKREEPAGESDGHPGSLNQQSQAEKENLMSAGTDEILLRHQQELDAAQQRADQARTALDFVMHASFANPGRAQKRMERYARWWGRQVLYDWLDRDAGAVRFGRRPGSIASAEGLTPSANGRRHDADLARRTLSEAWRDVYHTEAGLQQARYTFDRASQRQDGAAAVDKAQPIIAAGGTMPIKTTEQRWKDEFSRNADNMDLLAARFNNALDKGYEDGKAAGEKMVGMKDSESEIHRMLKNHPDFLGPMPKDPVARENADEARRRLPVLFDDFRKLRDRNDDLARALRERGHEPPAPGWAARESKAQDSPKAPVDLASKLPSHEAGKPADKQPGRPSPALGQQQPQAPAQRPPRFGDVARDRPGEPVAYHQPQPGDKPPALAQGYQPPQQEAPAVGKTFGEKMQEKKPEQQPTPGTFAEKLAAAKGKPKSQQDKSRGRDDEIER